MKLWIKNMKKGLTPDGRELFEAASVSLDPGRRWAVAFLPALECFVALRVTESVGDELRGDYVDHRFVEIDPFSLSKYTVSWDCIRYGFCKLLLWDPEGEDRDGRFEHTVARFTFDWPLYRRSYEERNGVPCPKKGPEE